MADLRWRQRTSLRESKSLYSTKDQGSSLFLGSWKKVFLIQLLLLNIALENQGIQKSRSKISVFYRSSSFRLMDSYYEHPIFIGVRIFEVNGSPVILQT